MDQRDERESQPLKMDQAPLKKQRREHKAGSRRWISLVVLVVIAGLALGATYVLPNWKPAPPEAVTPSTTAPSSVRLTEYASTDVTRVAVRVADGATNVFVRQGDAIVLEDAPTFALDQSKVSSIFSNVSVIYATPVAEAPESLAEFGLDNPRVTIEATYSDGKKNTFYVGAQNPGQNKYYWMLAGDPRVFTVYNSTVDRYLAARSALHTVSFPKAQSSETIRNVLVEAANREPVEVGFSDVASLGISTVRLKQPYDYEADSEKLTALFEGVAALSVSAFAAEALPETMGIYGLVNPVYHVVITETFTDSAGASEERESLNFYVGSKANATQTYVREEGSNTVYLMNTSLLTFLEDVTPAKLVDRFANIISIKKVDAITVTGANTNMHMGFTRTPEFDAQGNQVLDGNGNPREIETFDMNGAYVDETVFRKLYQVIIGTRVDGVIPDDKVPGPQVQPVLTVRYQLNEIRDEEVIEYLPYDAEHYAVRRNGVTLFYILKTKVDKIPRAIDDVVAGTFVAADYGV